MTRIIVALSTLRSLVITPWKIQPSGK